MDGKDQPGAVGHYGHSKSQARVVLGMNTSSQESFTVTERRLFARASILSERSRSGRDWKCFGITYGEPHLKLMLRCCSTTQTSCCGCSGSSLGACQCSKGSQRARCHVVPAAGISLMSQCSQWTPVPLGDPFQCALMPSELSRPLLHEAVG